MPKGGFRVSAGRKPYKRQQIQLITSQSRPGALEVEARVLLEPPSELPEAEAVVWRKLAPHALEAQTLTPRTAEAFALLCESSVSLRTILAEIREQGWTYLDLVIDGAGQEHRQLKANPLVSKYSVMLQRVEAQMKNFAIAPFGKPVMMPVVIIASSTRPLDS